MGPDFADMIQKTENVIINNSHVVGDSFTEKSCNGDNSSFTHDEDNSNVSGCSTEEFSSSSSDYQLSDTGTSDVKYFVTAGNSPLSVVIKRCSNLASLSEDSCSNTFDRVYKSPTSSAFENPVGGNAEQSYPESEIDRDKDVKKVDSNHLGSTESLHESMVRNPCTVEGYVEAIKTLVEIGCSASENDLSKCSCVDVDDSKSLDEESQSENTKENAHYNEEKVNSKKNDNLSFHLEPSEEVACGSEVGNGGFASHSANIIIQMLSNDQVCSTSSSTTLCEDNPPLNTVLSSYVVMDDGSLESSTNKTIAQASEINVERNSFICENSNSSLMFGFLQPEATNSKSDCETFDSILETTNSFDRTSLIDSAVDRIVYSPTLFSDDEDDENGLSNALGVLKKSPSDVYCRRSRNTEARRLKQLQLSMIGLPPPPSFTNPQLSVDDILQSLKENEAAMLWPVTSMGDKGLQTKHLEDAKACEWPDSASFCHPDIYYNNGLNSEQFASLSQKFVQRYVGAETACICNVAGSMGSARKRNRKLGVGFSPGRRLSHLARRRKAFSRDNLLSSNSGSLPKSQPNALPERRQIVIAAKTKTSLKGPVNSKPSQTIKSALYAGSKVLSHKRALFQSPDEGKKNCSAKKSQSGSKMKNNFRSGVESFKRALFASASKDKEISDAKRSRNDGSHPVASSSKRKLLFDNVDGPTVQVATSSKENVTGKLSHPGSSSTKKYDTKSVLMSSGHKKKLLWAVAESLRKKGINMSHALFRPCASSLARICRSLLPDLQRHNGSTSELMLEIADKYASDIVREKKAEANSL